MPDHEEVCQVFKVKRPEQVPEITTFSGFRPFPAEASGAAATRTFGRDASSPTAPSLTVPSPAGLAAIPRREPLYDLERIGLPVRVIPTPGIVGARPARAIFFIRGQISGHRSEFFSSAAGYTDLTNIPFDPRWPQAPCLPAQHWFYWYRLTVVPDLKQDPGSLLQVWERGTVSCVYSGLRTLFTWPLKAVMSDPRELPQANGEVFGLERIRPRAAVTIAGKPLEVPSQEAFEFVFENPVAPPVPVAASVLMYGIKLTPPTG